MSGGEEALIRSARFRAEREADWRRLDGILKRVERRGLGSLSFVEAQELASLYRQAVSSLSLAREISLDRALLSYLETLASRAYLAVYAPQESLRDVLQRLFVRDIPRAFRRLWLPVLAGLMALVLGFLAGWFLYADDPGMYQTLVPGEMDRTPSSSREALREGLFNGREREAGELGAFAGFLYTHNARIAVLVFGLGVFACFPAFALTLWNGMILGAFAGLYAERGLGLELAGWLSIHGVTELGAVVVACGGGLALGMALLFPGRQTRRASLRAAGPDAVRLAILAAVMLAVAAPVEGFARQWVTSTPLRLAIGWGIGALWLVWLVAGGRRR